MTAMFVEKATSYSSLPTTTAGPYGEQHAILLLHTDDSGSEHVRYGSYPYREQMMAVAGLQCIFLKDIITDRGFFTHDDAYQAYVNAHNACVRRWQHQSW